MLEIKVFEPEQCEMVLAQVAIIRGIALDVVEMEVPLTQNRDFATNYIQNLCNRQGVILVSWVYEMSNEVENPQ